MRFNANPSTLSPRSACCLGQFGTVSGAQWTAVVNPPVLGGAERLQVLGSIVVADLVQVMNVFIAPQKPAVGQLPVQPMLQHIALAAVMGMALGFVMVGGPDVYIAVVVVAIGLLAVRQLRAIGIVAVDKAQRVASENTSLGRGLGGHFGCLAAAALTKPCAPDHFDWGNGGIDSVDVASNECWPPASAVLLKQHPTTARAPMYFHAPIIVGGH